VNPILEEHQKPTRIEKRDLSPEFLPRSQLFASNSGVPPRQIILGYVHQRKSPSVQKHRLFKSDVLVVWCLPVEMSERFRASRRLGSIYIHVCATYDRCFETKACRCGPPQNYFI